tara:strand:+ start:1107 stop:1499 length:393 start_codon:yes stop_codon:yes gene_type:complete
MAEVKSIHLTQEIIDKLDARMEEMRGVGLSDIDLSLINYALFLLQDRMAWNKNSCLIEWSTEDVHHVALSHYDHKLTEDEAIDVLGSVEHNHDACFGVNWDTIHWHVQDLIESKEKKPETINGYALVYEG